MLRKRTQRLILACLSGSVLIVSGCGNTWRGVGQDMETLGRRMQGGNASANPSSDYDYYRATPPTQY